MALAHLMVNVNGVCGNPDIRSQAGGSFDFFVTLILRQPTSGVMEGVKFCFVSFVQEEVVPCCEARIHFGGEAGVVTQDIWAVAGLKGLKIASGEKESAQDRCGVLSTAQCQSLESGHHGGESSVAENYLLFGLSDLQTGTFKALEKFAGNLWFSQTGCKGLRVQEKGLSIQNAFGSSSQEDINAHVDEIFGLFQDLIYLCSFG